MMVSGVTFRLDPAAPGFNIVAVTWGAMNLIVCFILALISIDRGRHRAEERFGIDAPVSVFADGVRIPARLFDLSSRGAGVSLEKPLSPGTEIAFEISGIGRIGARVMRASGDSAGVMFVSMDHAIRRRLIERLFAGDLDSGVRHAQWRELFRGLAANFV
jgi:hypothetical protein